MASTRPAAEPARLPPSSYTHRVRVRYAECDPMCVAHHGSYAVWLEEARTEMLRQSGISYADMEASGAFLVITRMELKYRRSIKYDDVIAIRVDASAMGRTRLRHEYKLVLIERMGKKPDPTDPGTPIDGVCAIATTELACVDTNGRPGAMPAWLLGEPGVAD